MAIDQNVATTVDRARECFELRLTGLSVAAIADALDISPAQVYRDMKRWTNELLTPLAAEARKLEVARLERLLLALDAGVLRGDVNSIRTAASISAQLSDLLGLKQAAQVEHTVRVIDAVDEEILRLSAELDAKL